MAAHPPFPATGRADARFPMPTVSHISMSDEIVNSAFPKVGTGKTLPKNPGGAAKCRWNISIMLAAATIVGKKGIIFSP